MKNLFAFLLLLLAAGAGQAAPTGIAQLPLLNINGTGNVKPNLMLLYDNSGSMSYTSTPDYVADGTTCRAGSTMSSTTSCTIGHPPFNSPDFNKQYYNPDVRYTPPVRADGSSYPSLTRSVTGNWAAVTTDAFGINRTDLQGRSRDSTNLTNGVPDLRWCDSNGNNCEYNAATYTYPTNARNRASIYYTAPYYYRINVSEYCTNANLTDCKTVAVGAGAPPGYPIAARVRWCSDRNLTTCRAKYDDVTYKYPRFGNPNAGVTAAYGTIAIGSSNTSGISISSVTVAEPGGTVTITSGSVNASGGTGNTDRQAAAALALATAIINKTGLVNQYLACVRTGSGSVPSCSTYGITLAANNVVAVIPIECASGTSGKDIGDCSVVADASRSNWAMTVNVPSKGIPTTVTPIGSGAAGFVRTDIVESVKSYPRTAARTDCADSSSCSYDEEMTNYANWYAYYKSRNQMMKTAVGQAFQALNSNFNVGLVSLELAAATRDSDANNAINSSGDIIRPRQFSGDNRSAWYAALYGMNGNKSTPVRLALDALGNMYANKGRFAMPAGQEVVQYPCQQNFTFITTDGYWNGGAPSIPNNDNVENPRRFCTAAKGCVDTRSQSAPSLADVALYWYNGGSATGTSSLRPALEDWTKEGLVLGKSDDNKRLHMNTYALGLGVDGIMTYEKDYDTNPKLDFYKLTTGVQSGCPWNNNGAYVWPDPKTGDSDGGAAYQSRVDDLWHAAVNGRGKYFSASDPTEVVEGLGNALSAIQTRSGAASAAATSTPNITTLDNDVFSSTFTTVKWFGELSDRKISPSDGTVATQPVWTTTTTLGKRVDKTSDTRTIWMLDTANGGLKPFRYASMNATEKSWFDNKCSELSQCATLAVDNRAVVNAGANIVNWLRGWQQYADDAVMRAYSRVVPKPEKPDESYLVVLGDIASSKPAYLRDPRKGYTLAGYAEYKDAKKGRGATVFVGANDGMLHAFAAGEGDNAGAELWAYAPRITMKKLYRQASTTYGTNHQYTVDGAPEVADVQINGEWRSVLVSGLNAGGRGYFALDVTDPANPRALWELCADSTVCGSGNYDADIGLTFGNPQFGTWRDAGGVSRWVVFLTSGYNNVPGTEGINVGDGRGYLYVVDVATGRVLSKTSTGAGNADTPSGFARIAAITANPYADPLVTHVYGGDNLGKMWRFDFTAPGNPKVLQMGDAGSAQPITARPEVTLCQVDSVDKDGNVSAGVSRIVAFGTGRLLDLPDIADPSVQSTYVLKDTGSAIAAADWRKASMGKLTLTASEDGGTYTASGNADLSSQAGWYVDFSANVGERVNLDPTVVAGTLSVVANIPSNSTSCSVGGRSNLYLFDVCSGTLISGATLSSAAAAVGTTVVQLPGGTFVQISTLGDGSLVTDPFPQPKASAARKAGWRRVRD